MVSLGGAASYRLLPDPGHDLACGRSPGAVLRCGSLRGSHVRARRCRARGGWQASRDAGDPVATCGQPHGGRGKVTRCPMPGVAGLLAHLGIARADVAGYSLGGLVAVRTAIQHPELVGRLVAISVAFRRDGSFPEVLAAMDAMGPEAAGPMQVRRRPARRGLGRLAARGGAARGAPRHDPLRHHRLAAARARIAGVPARVSGGLRRGRRCSRARRSPRRAARSTRRRCAPACAPRTRPCTRGSSRPIRRGPSCRR